MPPSRQELSLPERTVGSLREALCPGFALPSLKRSSGTWTGLPSSRGAAPRVGLPLTRDSAATEKATAPGLRPARPRLSPPFTPALAMARQAAPRAAQRGLATSPEAQPLRGGMLAVANRPAGSKEKSTEDKASNGPEATHAAPPYPHLLASQRCTTLMQGTGTGLPGPRRRAEALLRNAQAPRQGTSS